jgi:hypothetical protein
MSVDDKRIKDARSGKDAQDDPMRNPDGIYSGASKRVAITDGTFAPVKGIPSSSKARGKVRSDQG